MQSGEKNWNPFKEGNDQASDNRTFSSSDTSLFSIAGIINKETFRKVHTEMDSYLADDSSSLGKFEIALQSRREELLRLIRELIASTNSIIDGYNPDKRGKKGCVAAWLGKVNEQDFIPDWDNTKLLRKYIFSPKDNFNKITDADPATHAYVNNEIQDNGTKILNTADE